MSERETLIETLDSHRGFLLHTAAGISEEQSRSRSTVSELPLAGLLKHAGHADSIREAIDGQRTTG